MTSLRDVEEQAPNMGTAADEEYRSRFADTVWTPGRNAGLVHTIELLVHQWFQRPGFDIKLNIARCLNCIWNVSVMAQSMMPSGLAMPGFVADLIHSYAHALIRRAAVFTGIERSALSELGIAQ